MNLLALESSGLLRFCAEAFFLLTLAIAHSRTRHALKMKEHELRLARNRISELEARFANPESDQATNELPAFLE